MYPLRLCAPHFRSTLPLQMCVTSSMWLALHVAHLFRGEAFRPIRPFRDSTFQRHRNSNRNGGLAFSFVTPACPEFSKGILFTLIFEGPAVLTSPPFKTPGPLPRHPPQRYNSARCTMNKSELITSAITILIVAGAVAFRLLWAGSQAASSAALGSLPMLPKSWRRWLLGEHNSTPAR